MEAQTDDWMELFQAEVDTSKQSFSRLLVYDHSVSHIAVKFEELPVSLQFHSTIHQ